MTDHRASFIAALDANPSDCVLRAVFADWLEEQGDGGADRILASGLRWMVENRRWPLQNTRTMKAAGKWLWHASGWWNAMFHDTHWIPHTDLQWPSMIRWPAMFNSDEAYIFSTRHESERFLAESLWRADITNPPAVVPQQMEMEGATL